MCIQTLCFNKLRKTRVSILVKPGCRARKWVKCNAVFIFCECTIYFHMLPLAWESKSTQICISQGISSSRNTRSNNHMQNGQNGATNRRLTSRTLIGGKAHRWAISHAWARVFIPRVGGDKPKGNWAVLPNQTHGMRMQPPFSGLNPVLTPNWPGICTALSDRTLFCAKRRMCPLNTTWITNAFPLVVYVRNYWHVVRSDNHITVSNARKEITYK